jgi:magnesium-protoporphyrin O-methyltransferase
MVSSCCNFPETTDRQFTAEKAAKELQAYRKGRLGRTTRLLRDSIVELGLSDGSLLDIGGGVGALTFELLDRGVTKAVVADASRAYVAAAREEVARTGRMESAAIVQGDLLELAGTLPVADLVTLDRVVCCYPAYEPMLHEAARHAMHGLALSYPRDRWFVRSGMWLENARRARKSGFRTFVHPPAKMRQVIERAGFKLARRRSTLVWTVDVFVR